MSKKSTALTPAQQILALKGVAFVLGLWFVVAMPAPLVALTVAGLMQYRHVSVLRKMAAKQGSSTPAAAAAPVAVPSRPQLVSG